MKLFNITFLVSLLAVSNAYSNEYHVGFAGGLGSESMVNEDLHISSGNIAYEMSLTNLHSIDNYGGALVHYGIGMNIGNKIEFIRHVGDCGFVAPKVSQLGYSEIVALADYHAADRTYRVGVGFTMDRNTMRPLASFETLMPVSDNAYGVAKVKMDSSSLKKGFSYVENSVLFGLEAKVGGK